MKTILTGQPERLYIEYRDADNVLTDPTTPKITIFAPSGAEVTASTDPTKESTGVYFFLFSISTAYATERGTYQAWWEGYINSGPVYMDEPQYFEVIDTPTIASSTSAGRHFVNAVRRAIKDNRETDYIIEPQDMNFYIQESFGNANSIFNLEYTVFVSTAGNDKTGRIEFQKDGVATSLPATQRAWYLINCVRDILESEIRLNIYGTGIINAGDVKINLAQGLRAQTDYLEKLNDRVDKLEMDLKLNGGAGGFLINNYAIRDLVVSEW